MQKSFSFSGRASNPAKKKASPAQLAARKKFAEMARSGAFKKAKRAADRDKNPAKTAKRKPAKKTVSQKISQLVHEGYPQKQAVAVALSEKRAGKVKSNPMGEKFVVGKYYETRSIGDQNIKIGATVLSRTDKTVKVKGTDGLMKSSYRLSMDHNGNECFYPWGRYSMSPMICADDMKAKSNPLPQVSETILQQLGGNKFIAMTGASRISGDSTHLSFKIPRNTSKANAIGIYYDRGSDTYTMKFWKQKGAPTFEMVLVEQFDDVYADMLRTLFTDVTGLETSLGTMGRRTNPAKSGKKTTRTNPIKRSSRSAVVPNPLSKKIAISKKKANFPYMVEYKNTGTGKWNAKAAFKTLNEAKNLAYVFADQYPKLTIRVVKHTGGSM